MPAPTPSAPAEHFDVLIVGAGLSGVAACCHILAKCPNTTFAVVEARDNIGGTWDLFRYPGARSDSDMFTFSYSFRPWRKAKAIVEAPCILQYIRDTAREHGIVDKIRFNHRVKRASWSSTAARWTIEAERGESREPVAYVCNFLLMCSGYYDYQEGYTPDFPGRREFGGTIVHPQNWRADLELSGKRVVLIGSGATAVTLAPHLARSAASLTLLQRSPSYVVAWPDEDRIANALRRWLPVRTAGALARWKNVAAGMYFYRLCQRKPDRARAMLLEAVRAALGPEYDIAAHFTPSYNPWQQRLCLAANGDFFQSIREGRTTVITDEIETFLADGLKLRSGRQLAADVVVTATGLNLQVFGGAELVIDGQPVNPAHKLSYKGVLYSEMPNFASVTGYSNASWTLKAELVCGYVCRLLNYMKRRGYAHCTPRSPDPAMERLPPVALRSGYIQRAMHKLPKQGTLQPWRIQQNYLLDVLSLRYGAFNDGVLKFAPRRPHADARREAIC